MRSILERRLPIVQAVLTLAGILLLALLFRNFSFEVLLRSLSDPLLLVIALIVPYSMTFLLDVVGWSQLFPREVPVGIRKLGFIRLVSEPFTLTLPGGAMVGESLKAALVSKTYGISFAESGASVLLYRFGLGASQTVFIVIGLLLAYPVLELESARLIGREGLGVVVLTVASVFAAVLVGLFLFVNWFQPARRLLAADFVGSGSPWKKKWVQVVRGIHKLEATIAVLVNERLGSFLSALMMLFVGWIIGVAETFLMARSLGIPLTIEQAFIVESMGSIFRIVGFFLPSGIGGQDWGYTALLSLYTVHDPLAMGASFALLKRIREGAWIGAGFLVLAATLGGKSVRTTLAQAVNS